MRSCKNLPTAVGVVEFEYCFIVDSTVAVKYEQIHSNGGFTGRTGF